MPLHIPQGKWRGFLQEKVNHRRMVRQNSRPVFSHCNRASDLLTLEFYTSVHSLTDPNDTCHLTGLGEVRRRSETPATATCDRRAVSRAYEFRQRG